MKCPVCSKDMVFDGELKTFYCDDCNHLYSEDEVVIQDTELYKLTPFMSIPFVNLMLLKYARNRDERRVYNNIIISNMLMTLVYCFIIIGVLYVAKGSTLINFRVEARQYLETTIKSYDPRGLQPIVYDFKNVAIGNKPEEGEQLYELNDEVVRLLTNSSVTGDTLKHIVDQYPAYSYLVQTLSCAQKYQDKNYYFCVGHTIREANDNGGTSNTNFYIGDLDGTFTQLAEVIGSSILEDEKTIMYIYESQRFDITPIYDRQGKVIGLAFVELEV